ncbi:DAK2 domain-containing protein [Nocardia sp. CNY236]|uniref:DAK2 domain-containing protein n=1 Tax=Nocardia sp. CNY236 TaxID=1169152 RepID=UPI00048BA9EA|nr:DAK2 domain-containing protein [Nocardia sp. CNY236]
MDGAALLRWGHTCVAELEHRREEINALNVFPVPDADTGTNLLATMRCALGAARTAERDAYGVLAAMAHGATIGARGNSGIILSQVLRGLAEAVRGGPLTADRLRIALARAAELVRESLSVPIEGTILTVLDCASVAVAACPDHSLADVALAAADGAAKALGDTPSQLGVLRETGVVDAGARGLVVLLDSLVSITRGDAPTRPEYARPTMGATRLVPGAHAEPSAEPRYEVMYSLTGADESSVAQLRTRLGELGDSVVVVGDGDRSWSAHVHCADAGAAVEAGLAAGALSRIRIENVVVASQRPALASPEESLAAAGDDAWMSSTVEIEGIAEFDPVSASVAATPTEPSSVAADRGVLAVATGRGATVLFEEAGARVLVGAPSVTATTLLGAIRRMPNREVLVLPNGALPAHELLAVGVAARDAQRDVLLLPSACMVQGLAALAVHDRGRIAVDDAFAMSEAAATTRWGSLRAASGRALTMVGMCEAGDGLGLAGQDVVVIDRDVRAAGRTLLDRLLAFGGELVTLLIGEAAPSELGDELAAHVEREFPGVEAIVYSGGQHGDLVQIGVE